ncbi:MAG: class II glutamine amidotransferase [Candidatus Aenigmatarchaeota archaeon]
MCGIIGVISKDKYSVKKALEMLKRLEYRGYDSVGYVTSNGKIIKSVGKVDNLLSKCDSEEANIIIAHTRWATHGKVNEINAHPHFDCEKNIFIVHNGTIENFEELKKELESLGHKFVSETDSEIFAHFFEQRLKENRSIKEIAKEIFERFKGTYAVLIYIKNLNKVIAIKNGSPLLIGISENKIFFASDAYAFSEETNKVIVLDDYNFVEVDLA